MKTPKVGCRKADGRRKTQLRARVLCGIYRFLDDEKRFAAHLFCKKYKDDAELL